MSSLEGGKITMKFKLNLTRNFELVPEGTRNLEITEVKITPSGAPQQMRLTMKDTETGATIFNTYKFDNNTSLWAMGVMLNIALGIEDGAEFDTKDAQQLVGLVLSCEVAHSEYNGKNYANVKKINELVGFVKKEPATDVASMPGTDLADL